MNFAFTRRATIMVCAAAALVWVAPARAQSGAALLQKCFQTYKGLTSYEGASNVDSFVQDAKGRRLQASSLSSRMAYKAPNRLMIRVTSPGGSREIYGDGQNVLIYTPSENAFTRVPTAPNMEKMAAVLLRQAGIVGLLDPLDLLSRPRLPKELGSLKAKGGSFSGKPVWIVSGMTRLTARQRDAKGKIRGVPVTTNWTWWIDKGTNLLWRVEARTAGVFPVQVRQGDKVVARGLPATRVLRHTVIEAKANPNPADSLFAFRPPKGAVEREARK